LKTVATGLIRIPFLPRQAIVVVTGGRLVASVRVEEAQHLVERAILQHQLDNVLYLGQLGHGGISSVAMKKQIN
jgi:hypothetical protein